ncbi:uncharacterized protein LOC133860537 [Alnus glutinosa]|uniref:uncharacterized protein LOC133860537 n=1 Tax=Alnus glutinosa TaxID=3517 RepID=UPI002D76E867|nr:uncharacterized protein LOC133860537 [Alnus glutinosa]
MGKPKTLDSFFKKKDESHSTVNTDTPLAIEIEALVTDERPSKCPRIQPEEMDATIFQCDPGLRRQIWEFPINLQDKMRRAYINAGPCQPILLEYPVSGKGNNRRRFQASWFNTYSTWLEYSKSKDAIFCLQCYVFAKKSTGRPGSDAFIVKGFNNWKKASDTMNSSLMGHVGKDPNSPHKNAVKCCEDLMNQSRHIDKLIEKQTSQETENNRLRLKTSVDSVQWLAFQACAFRGYDESSDSKNQGNFIELIKLQIENIRGQGYDGGSNMRGEWNGLQALFLRDCPYAYYVHCMAHKLQLALVAASREAKHIHQFFIQLASIINIVGGSSKRHDELQSAQAAEIESLIVSNKIETGKGANQIGTLQRPGDTRWSSHYQSIYSLIRMFGATCSVINNISKEGANYSQRGDAEAAYMVLTSFEFVFILHLMNDIMGLTNMLCQTLQQKSIDILNAMSQVSTTQLLIQQRREDGWEPLLATVKSFCEENDIDIPDMNAHYSRARGRSRRQDEGSLTTVEHHFRVDIFTAAIDFQLQELKNRFGEQAVELLTLSVALSPKDAYKSFKIDDICKLAEKFYPKDFNKQERFCLKFQLEHYKLDVPKHSDFQNMSTLSELCRGLADSGKSKIYPLIDRLIRLVLTLPVSTATTERAFSAMKLIKTRLRSKMEDEFLADHMVVYIEKEIAKNFTSEMIMDKFYSISNRRRA